LFSVLQVVLLFLKARLCSVGTIVTQLFIWLNCMLFSKHSFSFIVSLVRINLSVQTLKSALQRTCSYTFNCPFSTEIHHMSDILKVGKLVIFYWVPRHASLPTNEATDAAAERHFARNRDVRTSSWQQCLHPLSSCRLFRN
jgi:hypothetical protein